MSRYFVNDPPAPVYEFDPDATLSEAAPNIIWVKSRMDVETDARVKSELVTLGADGKTPEIHTGAHSMALLVHNIVRWEGPDLSMVPCTAENIRRLDPSEPHLQRVLEEIARRNTRRAAPNPKSPTPTGSSSAGPADGAPAADGGRPAQLARSTRR